MRVPLLDVPSADLLAYILPEEKRKQQETQDLPAPLDALSKVLREGRIALVHCRVGSSRSASFVLAFLVREHGKTLWQAYDEVRMIHSIKPNKGFAKQLLEFEIKVRGVASMKIDGFGNWKQIQMEAAVRDEKGTQHMTVESMTNEETGTVPSGAGERNEAECK